jgi:hypothetical protein
MWVFMLKSCDRQNLMTDYVLELNLHVCSHAKIMWLCWNLMIDYMLELNLHVQVHAKIM